MPTPVAYLQTCPTCGYRRFEADPFEAIYCKRANCAMPDHRSIPLYAEEPPAVAALRAIMDGQIGGSVDWDAERFREARSVLAALDAQQAGKAVGQ